MTGGLTRRRRPPRLRRAWALVGSMAGEGLRVRSFLRGLETQVDGPMLAVLSGAEGWRSPAEVRRALVGAGDLDPAATVCLLLAAGFLVEEGSPEARADEAFRRAWRWGPLAGAFHHALRDPPFLDDETASRQLAARATHSPARPVLPAPAARRVPLPSPRVGEGALLHLRKRESVREFSRAPLRRSDLADVLYAGLGVRSLVRDPVQGRLPLKLAPSGGARNPVEGYLYALRVRGLPRGVYRYSGLTGDLEPVHLGARTPPRLLLGGQEWTDGAAAVIFLVATFERTAWKYRHPVAYRVILLEAGHVAQNLLVSACDLGLAATPTCAFADGLAEAVLRVEGPDRGLLHAVVLGPRAEAQRPSRSRSARSRRAGP